MFTNKNPTDLDYERWGYDGDGNRECDNCGRVTDAGEFPDWINGVCEFCDPTILDHPDNERSGGFIAPADVVRSLKEQS